MSSRQEFHAERLGLLIVDPTEFDIQLRKSGKGNRVCFASGEKITDKRLKARIKGLVLPPAWKEVRICVAENGHIQATGRDEKGRLQYRYHDSWVGVRNAVKTERLLRFGRSLPKLRKRVDKDLKRKQADRLMTSATAARLIDLSAMRPGHEKYAEDGGRGVASLRKNNLRMNGKRAILKFVAKSKKPQIVAISDKRLVRSLEKVRKGGGERLFRYRGKDRKSHVLTANILNDYLREAGDKKISAKDFRTFHGSAEALRFLVEEGPKAGDSKSKKKRTVAAAMRSVSELLRNTPTVARASYVHPEIITAFEEDRLPAKLMKGRRREGLTRVESGLMRFLEETATAP